MKKFNLYSIVLLAALIVAFTNCKRNCCPYNKEKCNAYTSKQADTSDRTNDFYDNAETYDLSLSSLVVEGETSNPGTIDLSKLPLRTVIVKEAMLDGNGNKFIGAYRYDGYSLYDILNLVKLQKANEKEFRPIIDLYVSIENNKGEKVLISWGEIYYPNHLHEIIIARSVARIVPSKTKDLWPLPKESKLIVSSDLLTERNISMPSKITIKSYPKSFETIKGLKHLYSPKIDIYSENKLVKTLESIPDTMKKQVYPAIFYGKGRGIHSTQPFIGVMLKDIMAGLTETSQKNLRTGAFMVVGKDGYRCVYSFSEVMNRNDQAEVLLVCHPEVKDDGIFRLFPACDFFSDRAVKGIAGIYFSAEEK